MLHSPDEFKFAVFGRIIHTDNFIKSLRAHGFPVPLVITSLDNEYIRDKRLLTPYGLYGDLESLANAGIAILHKMETVNSNEALDLLSTHKCNIGISINSRNIIKKPIIDFFDGRIFNIHDSYLPNERGGALNTWRILNGINSVGNTIHYLDEGIDTGPLVLRHQVQMNKHNPHPVDYLLTEVDNCKHLITEFLQLLLKSEKVPSIPQENDKSFYFPRLFTELNGLINWDWDVSSVERFIRAFSKPYPGAFTYYRDNKIHILDAFVETSVTHTFHPFSNGKIITIFDNGNARVVAGCRAMVLTEITVDGETDKPGRFLSVKYTLQSGVEELAQARYHVPTTKEMNKAEK